MAIKSYGEGLLTIGKGIPSTVHFRRHPCHCCGSRRVYLQRWPESQASSIRCNGCNRPVHVNRRGVRFTTADRGPVFAGAALVAMPWFAETLRSGWVSRT